jgi:hypothetical protein
MSDALRKVGVPALACDAVVAHRPGEGKEG